MNQAFSKIWIVIISAVLIASGGIFVWQYFGAPKEEVKDPEEVVKDETADWKSYTNPEVDFIFKYPNDWEIIDDYFDETAAGIKAKERTIILQQIGNRDSNDWIRMNPRQFQTDIGKCKGSVCTYSEKVEILNILDKVVESFRKTEIDETANWKTYQNEDFGVKFSYPKDWYFSPPKDWYVYFGEPEGKILLGKELAVSPYTGERDPLYKIFKIISANPTEIALKFLKGKYNSSYYTLELQEKFNFQKKQAQKVLITCTSEYYTEQEIGAKEEMIIVVLDDYTSFIIPLSNRSPEYAYPFTKEQSDIINQILSTFKFVEKEEN